MFKTTHPSTYHYASTLEQEQLAPPQYSYARRSTEANQNQKLPIPTNCWWGNLIHHGSGGPIEPVWSNPYAIRVVPGRGLVVSVSADHRSLGPVQEIHPGVRAARFYLHGFVEDMVLSTADGLSLSPGLEVFDWDDFGVRVRLGTNENGEIGAAGASTMEASLVSGMAFVSATYAAGTKPRIETQHGIISIQGRANHNDYEVAPGSKLVLELNNGQSWAVYSDAPLRLSRTGNRLTATRVVASATTVRIARVDTSSAPNRPHSDDQKKLSPPLDVLDQCAGCVVLGGRVRTLGDDRYDIEWKTRGDGPLIHYALEHHLRCFVGDPPVVSTVVARSATRGTMHGIVVKPLDDNDDDDNDDDNKNNNHHRSCVWQLTERERLSSIGFGPVRAIDPAYVRDFSIDKHLANEVACGWGINTGGSYYFNGKTMQKYASLCLLAHDEDVVPVGDETIRKRCLQQLSALWDSFLSNNEWPHPLVYDEVYGGIVSSRGFAAKDPWVDFGNTVYNDHHYHYGYWLVSAAIFLHLCPNYPRRNELVDKIDVLVRDVANPNPDDPWFPRFRHFDWYLGHSYSHGVTPMADGKDQESVSEEINFHYGLMLWGMATGRDDVKDLGSLMLKINARAAKTYFFMDCSYSNTEDDDRVVPMIHPPEFRPNRVTGIFFDNKADCTTWFSPERHCIHGIQMLPVSPATPLFRTQSFVRDEWESILDRLSIVRESEKHPNPWQSLLFVNGARIAGQRDSMMRQLESVPMDDGLSRAWALYMAATTNE
eukprot:jgi/Psemu1/319219/estExt_fgenesh1_pm.C_1860001